MINTDRAKYILAVRRDIRDHENDGWEFLGEGGGKIWELYRGKRYDHVITHAEISKCGKGVWVKTAQKEMGK